MADVLVAFASKMEGTTGISERVAETLRKRGLTVDLRRITSSLEVDPVKGLVVGSAIYNGHWRPEAVHFLERAALVTNDDDPVPVWLFHSGPLGDDKADEAQPLPKKVQGFAGRLDVVDVKTFGGRMPEKPKGLVARLLARKMAGDWRDLDEARAWAAGIADRLLSSREMA